MGGNKSLLYKGGRGSFNYFIKTPPNLPLQRGGFHLSLNVYKETVHFNLNNMERG